ncbi:MAG: efflux RND transporter periplasmic adaptor subunit [Archangium sp.]
MNPDNPSSSPAAPEPRLVDSSHSPPPAPGRSRVPLAIMGGAGALLLLGGLLYARAAGHTNKVALSSAPKPVTAVAARPAQYRPSRRYVGTLAPWVQAQVGPQLVSAYVDTVLVRPGAMVKRGQVLATLDCRNTSASSQAINMQARALEATQGALDREASRVSSLLDGGFASPNEVEMKKAESASKQAQLLALQAQLQGSSLKVEDCVLRAPFDGEVAERLADPGAFARPGAALVTVVDRATVRAVADVPESDFDAVAPGTPVRLRLLANGRALEGRISRRAPSADLSTRTIHVEVDLPDPDRAIPVGTTAELELDVGQPEQALEIPLTAALVRGSKANLFVVTNGVAKPQTLPVLGERSGKLYVKPVLAPGSLVVTEGRATLAEGDQVSAKVESAEAAPAVKEGKL